MAMSLRPIVTICGTTGVGKSKLAIDLALHLNRSSNKSGWRGAKIINADAMQVYKGMDIITNKVPEAERMGVPHLLMGFKKPGEQYVVGQWVQDATRLIDEMHENMEIPIVVGGTSYWIQHLIFPDRLVIQEISSPATSQDQPWPPELANAVASLTPDLFSIFQELPVEPPSAKADPDQAFKLHALLSVLDPPISQRWHWKDTRKVLRSLQIIKDSRKRPSDIIQEQSSLALDHKPRYETLSLWLYAEPSALNPRLDARVDDMISQGLLDEVLRIRNLAPLDSSTSDASSSIDYTLGIYQSIGYREFCSYVEDPTEKRYKEAVERMKISTKQYAKRQISWIRNKLIPAVEASNQKELVAPFYLLDATALDAWSSNVEEHATGILDCFLENDRLPDARSLSETATRMLNVNRKDVDPSSILQARKKRICLECTQQDDRPVMIEEGAEWDIHQKTRSHRRLVRKKGEEAAVITATLSLETLRQLNNDVL